MAAGTSSTIRGSVKSVAPIQNCEEGRGGALRGLRTWGLQGCLPRASGSALCHNHGKLQRKAGQPVGLAGRGEAGGPGGLIGIGPAPLRLWNWSGRPGFRGTGLPWGGAWEAAVGPEG